MGYSALIWFALLAQTALVANHESKIQEAAPLKFLSSQNCSSPKISSKPGHPTQSSSALNSSRKSWNVNYPHTLSEAFTSLTESACAQDRLFTASSSTNQSASWASGQLLVAWLQTWWTPSLTRWFGWMKPLIRLCKWEQKVGQKSTLSSSIQKTIDRWESRSSELSVLAWKADGSCA